METYPFNRVAILVDGSYFHKRYRRLYPQNRSPEEAANDLIELARSHYKPRKRTKEEARLYRIFYYDCLPFDKKGHNPVTKTSVDFGKSPQAIFRIEFIEQLKKKRMVAIRLGEIRDGNGWIIRQEQTKKLLNGKMKVDDLSETDVKYDLRQKGVDMKIGLDIASLAYKKQVNQIVLVAGDTDFVPAAKMARREGIDFILDPMWNYVNPLLFEHIDGLQSGSPKPKQKKQSKKKAAPKTITKS